MLVETAAYQDAQSQYYSLQGQVDAADAIIRVANANMADAIFKEVATRGFDPKNLKLLSYGGGGPVGGGHRYPDKIGSKVPAIVNANIGYASGTTDAGQPWYQDGSFAFLSDGKINVESLRDFSVRAMVEQAVKTKALVNLYYGKAPKFAYYDGHSQGGLAAWGVAELEAELHDPDYLGAVSVAGALGLHDLFIHLEHTPGVGFYLAFMAYGIHARFPEFQPGEMLTPSALSLYPAATTKGCWYNGYATYHDLPSTAMLLPKDIEERTLYTILAGNGGLMTADAQQTEGMPSTCQTSSPLARS